MSDVQTESSRRIVTEFYRAYGIDKDPDACAAYLGDTFIQHNPEVPDGPEALLRVVRFRRCEYPQARNEVKLTIADGDLVMLHVHSVLVPGEPGRNVVDTFRVKDGRVVEHWDVIQQLPRLTFPPLTDNGTFNEQGDAILTDLDKTEANRQLVTSFYEDYGLEKDAEKCRRYFGEDDTYIQHNPRVQDGVEDFLRFVRYRREHFPQGKNMIKLTVAQGNLVGFHVHSVLTPGESGRNLVDIYRVVDGRIVEHWDTIQDIPASKFPPLSDHGLW